MNVNCWLAMGLVVMSMTAGVAVAQTKDGPPILHPTPKSPTGRTKAKPSVSNQGVSSVEQQALALYEQKRYPEASILFNKACTGGSFDACNNLGTMYRSGEGVPKDFSRAAELYTKACNGGKAIGCSSLGILYENGQGVTKDAFHADRLYAEACDADLASGCSFLGENYQLGLGIEKDTEKAKQFLSKGCSGGHQWGCDRLKEITTAPPPPSLDDIARQADAFYDQKRYAEAAPLYDQVCNGGNATACARLGYMYISGQGVAIDSSRSAALDSKACDGGVSTGCSNLGSLYSVGNGVEKDTEKAKQLLSKGCSLGNQWGCDRLKKLKQEAPWRLLGNRWTMLGRNQPYQIRVDGDQVHIQPVENGLTADLRITTNKKGKTSINGRYHFNGVEAYIGISQISDTRIDAVALSPTTTSSDPGACVSRTAAAFQAFSDGVNNHGDSCVSENLVWVRD
jgi:TPR repeat protein